MLNLFLFVAGTSMAFGLWQNSAYAGLFVWNLSFFLVSLIAYAKRKP